MNSYWFNGSQNKFWLYFWKQSFHGRRIQGLYIFHYPNCFDSSDNIAHVQWHIVVTLYETEFTYKTFSEHHSMLRTLMFETCN